MSSQTCGFPRIWIALRQRGVFISEKVVRRLMKEEHIKVYYATRRKKFASYIGEITPADKRPFTLTGNPTMRQLLPVDGWYSDYSYDAEGNVAGGWDPYHATAVKVSSPLTERTMIIAAFGGHAVTYRFDSSTEGKALPDEVLALVPSDQGLHKVSETI